MSRTKYAIFANPTLQRKGLNQPLYNKLCCNLKIVFAKMTIEPRYIILNDHVSFY